MLGHDGPPEGMWTENLVTDQPLAICPRMTLIKGRSELMQEVETYRTEIYPLFRQGFLLHPGGIGEQPARELALMREFDRVRERAQTKYDELTADPDTSERPE